MEEKVPRIRFPGFTDPWEQRKLGGIAERVQGNDGRIELPTLTVSAGNGWMAQEDRFNRNMAGDEQKRYTLLRKGELSYNHGNSKLAKYGVVFVLETYEEALVPRVYHSFRMKDDYNAKFCEYAFATKNPDRELSKLISSGARMDGLLNINYDEFMGINIMMPAPKEQNAISSFLESVDTLITLHQRKCDDLKTYKKGLLQKMFPKDGSNVPEIRFPGFTDPWEQRKLKDIFIFKYGDGNNNPSNGGPYPVFGAGGVQGGYTEFNAENSVIIGHMGDAGCVSWGEGKHFVTYNGTITKPKDDVFSSKFGYYLLSKMNLRKYRGGSGLPFLTYDMLNDMDTVIPPDKSECEKISECFSVLDNLITLHQRKCDELKEYKKGLLQQMFV